MAATIGASAIAALLPIIMNKMFPGKQGEYKPMETMGPEQQGLWGQLMQGLGGQGGLLQSGMGNLQGILSGSPEAFKDFEAPYQRQFNQQTVPGLAERFSGAGAGGQSSSAFGQQLGQAGAGLSEQLASMRGGMQQNALSQVMQMMGLAGKPQFQWEQMPGSTGMGEAMAPGIGKGIGLAMGNMKGEDWKQFNPKTWFNK